MKLEQVAFGSEVSVASGGLPRPHPRRHWTAVSSLFVLATFASGPAYAQLPTNRLQNDFGDLMRYMSELATQIGSSSRGQVLSFLNRVELFNVESEIDRLVGNPWQLSDSTSYKLSLAPMHLAYPVFDQQVAQMTRLDDIRTRRIQDLTVDSLGLITVNLAILDSGPQNGQLASSVLHYLNAREFMDLGVFFLAQQPFFPDNEDGWGAWKHQVASHQGMLALSVAGLGALVEAGAVSNSGTLSRCGGDRCRIGWYGSAYHIGYHLQPVLRGGVITTLPWLELSTGLLDQVRASSGSASNVFEVAVRESWLNRQAVSSGWNSFLEAAIRRVLTATDGYQGEQLTARGGVFVKRQRPFRLRHIVLRGSTEVESDMSGSLRYAVGLGIDYTKTGLTTVLQSSRTNVPHDSGLAPETRTGLFVAGTVESPEQYYVEAMQVAGRLLQEEWDDFDRAQSEVRLAEAQMRLLAAGNAPGYRLGQLFDAIRNGNAASEAHRTRLAVLVGDYLETRRAAYSLKQWKRDADDLHGSVDGETLLAIGRAVVGRLGELVVFLQAELRPLQGLRDQYSETQERAYRVPAGDGPRAAEIAAVLADLDRALRQESEAVSQALRLYSHYLGAIRRIGSLDGKLIPVRQFEPLSPRLIRRLLALVAQPIP